MRNRKLQKNNTQSLSKSACFDAVGGLCATFKAEEDGTLIKNALLLVEGTHKDNKGITHTFPPSRVQALARNTNAAIAQGHEIPFMADHSKELISNGQLKRLGDLSSDLFCRIITTQDLPNPKMTHLLGKMGAFAKVSIRNRIDEVNRGLIKLLSPGIDLLNERIAEVSAVALPAIHGPALFASALFSLDYDEAKKQSEAIRKQKTKCQEYFDICFGVLESIDAVPAEQMIGTDPKALKRSAVEKFMLDLIKDLEIDSTEMDANTNARSPQLSMQTAYSAQKPEELDPEEDEDEDEDEGEDEEDDTANASQPTSFMKRRKPKANFTMALSTKVLTRSNR